MSIVTISASAFDSIRKGTGRFIGITDVCKLHLLRFIQEYGQDSYFCVTGTSDEISKAMDGNVEFYRRYGIFTRETDGDFNPVAVLPDKEFVWIAGINATVDEYEKFCVAHEVSSVRAVAVVSYCDKNGCDGCSMYSVCLEQVLNSLKIISSFAYDTTIWNYVEVAGTDDSELHNDPDRFSVLPILREYVVDSVTVMENVKNLAAIAKRICSIGDKNTVFCLAGSATAQESFTFIQLAALLVVYGRKVDVAQHQMVNFMESYRMMFSSTYLYADEYLRKLSNPLGIAVSIRNGLAFVCVRDADIIQKHGIPQLGIQVYGVQFNCASRQILSKQVEAVQCAYSDISVKPLYDVFDLGNAEYEVAIKEASRLDTVIAELEELLSESNASLGSVTLNYTNTLIYEYNGAVYIGFLANTDAEYHYKVLPLGHGYSSFDIAFSVQQYDLLMDVRVLVDGDQLNGQLRGFIGNQPVCFPVPRGAKGCMLRAIVVKPSRLSEDCGFTFEELGIWSAQTSQCRAGTQNVLLQHFSRKGLRNKKFLTIWGGNHPSITTELMIDYSVWR